MAILKKLAFLLVLSLSANVFAEQVSSTKFRGLNNNENSVIIDPSDAQDLLNVDTTPGGQSIKKRSGYGLYKALATTKPILGLYHFFDSTGNDVQVAGSSTSLYGIVGGGTPTQLISSATLSSIWDCADSQGSAYCVNSNRNAYVKTNGATMTWYSAPLGTMVETTPDRVVVAGVSGFPNTIYVSESNTFTNFTVGIDATSPFNEVIASQGSKLTHLRYGCGNLLWWKDQSFGVMAFDDQFNVQIRTVSDTIGTFDNTSAIDPGGNVWFRGQDGHTWKYDCSFLTKESIDISPNTQVTGSRIANLWSQTSSSDFNDGLAYATHTDTSTSSGNVILLGVKDTLDNFNMWASSTGVFSVASSQLTVSTTSTGVGAYAYALSYSSYVPTFSTATIRIYAKIKAPTNPANAKCYFGLLDDSFNGWGLMMNARDLSYSNHLTANAVISYTPSPGGSEAIVYDTGISNDQAFHEVEVYQSSTGTIRLYFDGTYRGTSNYLQNGGSKLMIRAGLSGGTGSCVYDDVRVYYSTGTYYSAVKNAPNLTSWNTLGVTSQDDGGTHSFYVRGGTNPFTVTMSTPTWFPQTAGSIITISTATYFQFADTFTITAATQTPTLNDFTFNWFEGGATDQSYMVYFDNAIWESVAFGGGQTTNNYIFKKDLINDAWTVYNFGAGGLAVQANRLYFGDTAAGNVYIYGSATSDNGSAINAYWKGKDFTGQDPFLQNQLNKIDVFCKKDQGSTLTGTYTTDTSTATAYSISLSTSASIVQHRKILPSGKLGYTMNYKLSDSSTSSAWECFGYRMDYNPLPYRPTYP